ncbi:MAG: response regulator transcription factor [Elusimicrobia bacterium]|nr:response regulator transcription factor [Elusimicrobiota bacterium]
MARVLIVEDDGALMELMSLAFFKEGYEAHYAFNGQEGYEKILSLHPDLVILDLMLPVLNGVDVLRKMTAHPVARRIPVIVVTGYGDKPGMLEETIKAHGAVEYLRKPFELRELIGLAARTLAKVPKLTAAAESVEKGAVRLDVRYRTVWIGDKLAATLSPQKAAVLRLLIEAQGPVAKSKILLAVWGPTGRIAALEKTIQRLREDLGPAEGKRLQTAADAYELVG